MTPFASSFVSEFNNFFLDRYFASDLRSKHTPAELLPFGDEIVGDLVTTSNTKGVEGQPKEWDVEDDGVDLKELKHIHHFLSQTTRPAWRTPPPRNLGEYSHGKLQADQWRSCIEFDVPAAVAEIWIHDLQESEKGEQAQRPQKLVEATMLLAIAIHCATYRTSELHAARYTKCMAAYLIILKELYPNLAWRPNHYEAYVFT